MGEHADTSVTIQDPSLAERTQETVRTLVDDSVASKLAAQDPTLWGEGAESEARVRLSWTTAHKASRPLIGEIETLRSQLHEEGVNRVVLAGMGGSSLAPEVIAATAGRPLTVLDTTDPGQVTDALEGDLDRTVLVVSSKSGSTVETDTHRRLFAQAFAESHIDPASRMVVVTDPGTPLDELAQSQGYRAVFHADRHVGGRYSALTAFGLVPAGLAGADIAMLLDQAAAVAAELAEDSVNNPALQLGAALGAAHAHGAEKVVLANNDAGSPHALTGFGNWAEQLIAESTGKRGVGLLPIVVEDPNALGFVDAGTDATTVAIGAVTPTAALATTGSLGAQFLLWEHAVAIAGRLLGINPFDQPDVEAAKQAARSLLESGGDTAGSEPAAVHGAVDVHATAGVSGDGSLHRTLREFLFTAPEHGYLAVQAYLDRLDDASASLLRVECARRAGLQTTFGWGPRFLHSTGQYHKGGHQNGIFLQITGANETDLTVPDEQYTLGTLQLAQAIGDGQVLAEHGRPVLRLHLTDRAAGLAEVIRALQEVGMTDTDEDRA